MATKFGWDENKNLENIANHGIEFSTVVAVFDDPLSVTEANQYPNEDRYQTIGAALNGIVFVVHTIRELLDGDELLWIISARYATRAERKAYYEEN
jgi:uncharacterized DUF497 family protein